MKRYIIFALVALFSISASVAQTFDANFQNATLRIDYIFAGNASTQLVALDELSQSDGWAGRRVNMSDANNLAVDEEKWAMEICRCLNGIIY